MANNDEQFTPEEINEQIWRFSFPSRNNLQAGVDPNQRLIHDLRRVYHDDEVGEDARSLQQSWERIARAQQLSGQHVQANFNDRKVLSMNTFTKETGKGASRRTMGQRVGVFAAAAVALFLVGSMALVFNMIRSSHKVAQTQTTQTGAAPASQAKQGDTIAVFKQSDNFGVYGVDWSSDGKRIVSTGKTIFSWDAMTGKNSVEYATLPAYTPPAWSGIKSEDIFATAQWSPDGKSFALPYHSDIQIWDGTAKKLIKTLHYVSSSGSKVLVDPIRNVHWSADGKSISAIVPVVDSSNGPTNMLATFNLATGAKQSETILAVFGLNMVTWSPDGNYIATLYAEAKSVVVVNLHSGQIAYTYQGPATATDLTWSPDSKRLAVGFGDGMDITQVFDALTGGNMITHHGGTLPVWSPDGKYIAIARVDPTGKVTHDEIQLMDVATGKTVYVYKGHKGSVYDMVWSPDSKYIASGEGGGKLSDVHVWVAVA